MTDARDPRQISGAQAPPLNRSRRELLTGLVVGVGLPSLLSAVSPADAAADTASQLPMLQESAPAAQANQYVSDAHRAKGAEPGSNCSVCALFGMLTATDGTCSLFPKNRVSASGWCSAFNSQ